MDNSKIARVPTFRSGNFVFSRQHDRSEIEPLIYCARLLYETVIAIPVLPQWSTRFEEEIIRRSIFGTAALEGNPLKEEEVGKILHDELKGRKADRAEQEIRNLKARIAARAVELLASVGFPSPARQARLYAHCCRILAELGSVLAPR